MFQWLVIVRVKWLPQAGVCLFVAFLIGLLTAFYWNESLIIRIHATGGQIAHLAHASSLPWIGSEIVNRGWSVAQHETFRSKTPKLITIVVNSLNKEKPFAGFNLHQLFFTRSFQGLNVTGFARNRVIRNIAVYGDPWSRFGFIPVHMSMTSCLGKTIQWPCAYDKIQRWRRATIIKMQENERFVSTKVGYYSIFPSQANVRSFARLRKTPAIESRSRWWHPGSFAGF